MAGGAGAGATSSPRIWSRRSTGLEATEPPEGGAAFLIPEQPGSESISSSSPLYSTRTPGGRVFGESMEAMHPTDITVAAWVFAKLRHPNAALFDAVLEHAMLHPEAYDPRGWSRLAWAFSTLELPGEDLFMGRLQQRAARQREVEVGEGEGGNDGSGWDSLLGGSGSNPLLDGDNGMQSWERPREALAASRAAAVAAAAAGGKWPGRSAPPLGSSPSSDSTSEDLMDALRRVEGAALGSTSSGGGGGSSAGSASGLRRAPLWGGGSQSQSAGPLGESAPHERAAVPMPTAQVQPHGGASGTSGEETLAKPSPRATSVLATLTPAALPVNDSKLLPKPSRAVIAPSSGDSSAREGNNITLHQ